MIKRELNLRWEEIPDWLQKLVDRLRPHGFEDGLKKYNLSKVSTKPIGRSFTLESRHPWYETILNYRAVGGDLTRIKDPALQYMIDKLAMDSMKLETIIRDTRMPPSIERQLMRRMVQLNEAYPALFEIEMAFHYWRMGGELE